jgi:3-hydroxyisobutyrate dehydrogenase
VTSIHVSFAGLGRMGLPMCTNLVRHGFEVAGVDPDQGARLRAEAAGIRCAASLLSVAPDSDVVVSMLSSSELTLEVARAALPLMRAGATWIDMGSNDPALGEQLAALAAPPGVRVLEAPVGGGPVEAERGTLQLFVGGETSTLEAGRPVLAAMADPRRIHHVGRAGHGYLAKLLVNQLWFSQVVATTEALLLAARAGLDLSRLYDALSDSAVGGHFVDRDVAALLRGDYLATFGLGDCLEELEVVGRIAARLGTPYELSSVVLDTYRQALDTFGPVNGELLAAALLEQRAQLTLRQSSPS